MESWMGKIPDELQRLVKFRVVFVQIMGSKEEEFVQAQFFDKIFGESFRDMTVLHWFSGSSQSTSCKFPR
jgi:hypothetical protein